MQEKEVFSLAEIESKLKNIKSEGDKISFLRPILTGEAYKEIKKSIVKLYCPLVLKSPRKVYELSYDSLSEGLEPIYFWILDFMRDSPPGGLGMAVAKSREEFEASSSSGYFGEIGQRATLMQKQAVEYLGVINQVIKAIINLIYDLKEFEMRIKMYDDLRASSAEMRQAASHSLKGVWMDQVDIKKGKGSINMLAQDLNFITLRDAFFYIDESNLYEIKDEKELDEKLLKKIDEIDLNDRVQNILKRKVYEYIQWKKMSEKEIKNRFNVERAYLKSQVGTLKLYASWVKPYLKTAQKLKMREFNEADIVESFSNMEIKLELRGKKFLDPAAVHQSFAEYSIPKKYYMVLDVEMAFRSVPTSMQGQGGRHYLHGGRADMKFKAYVFDEIDVNALDELELYDDIDLIEGYVGVSLKSIQEEIDYFMTDKKKEEEKKAAPKQPKFFEGFDNPLKGVFSGGGSILSPIRDIFSTKPPGEVIADEVKKAAEIKAEDMCFLTYNIYKKTHGMLNLP